MRLSLRLGLPVALLALAAGAAVLQGAGASAPLAPVTAWIVTLQRDFHRELTDGLRAVTAGGGTTAAFWLVLASFLYGVFHAAGPGHGKAVITTYLLTQKERLSRGIGLAAAAAAVQGLTAIVLVYGLIWAAGWIPRETQSAVAWSERMSYAFVILIGVMLAWRGLRQWFAAGRSPAQAHDHAPDHHHDHHHPHAHGDHACGCGHAHAPTADEIAQARDWRTALGLVLSIGLRPCSGAIIVLVFAKVAGVAWAGLAAVAAMSAGTALAIAILATVAVTARRWAVALAGRSEWSGLASLGAALACGGGLLIIVIGGTLLGGSFAPAHPMGL